MALAIFDLDNTLIGGDSDHLWGEFLIRHNYVDGEFYQKENDRFYREYQHGSLDIHDWLEFQLKPLAAHSLTELQQWRKDFIEEEIHPILLPKAAELIDTHRRKGDRLLIITATNSFITEPIASILGITDLIATDPELIDGEYTGAVYGIPSYQDGKIDRLNSWLKQQDVTMDGSCFYSDSHNDLPLLKIVDNPVAVDPDNILMDTAKEREWPIISLRS
ncbi:MAG: HAD family hydrolase [Gammaproteobacteria bacterium]|uniref:Histidinol-phosphatase n=1 Tax=Candidatus Thiopontia autotrophica TaxID=2841688 RepID=A0A8J6PAG4_9GAMM|nr:HAD family hydrolase [Candidatus Thiopontia autotrophica]MBL6969675.1 HAD family hydrolase [Gammaproteobacteria bacterium]